MTRKETEREIDARIDLFRRRLKDSDDLKVKDDVFDTRTFMNLYTLAKKGALDALGGSVSTGKEANIFSALKDGTYRAVKIYRISTSDFKAMDGYILGDPRFGNIKGTRRAVISAWTRKEYRNLLRAEEAGIPVPHPYAILENIMVMDFIGRDGSPAPLLKDVQLSPQEAELVFQKTADYMAILYKKAQLVHADLSEFNILYHEGPVVIDMGQSVTLDHPLAEKFLARDVTNVARFFRKRYGIGSEDDIWKKIKSQD
ncbi:MAG: serine protein kinase RIO [Methanosarcinales archaeon]|nr:serine protein kinase RIO [Methanosarcinales archaeon]